MGGFTFILEQMIEVLSQLVVDPASFDVQARKDLSAESDDIFLLSQTVLIE
jgi:hypothetical protein